MMQANIYTTDNLASIPVLHQDDSRLDWNNAKYEVTIDLQQKECTVKHDLSNAPELNALLSTGDVVFATEIRCPRTLSSRIEYGNINKNIATNKQHIKFSENERLDNIFLIPGILAIKDTHLQTSGLHELIREKYQFVSVPIGWWLARGKEYQFNPLTISLLKFIKDEEEKLEPGTMYVEEADDIDNPYFRVTLAAELYDRSRFIRELQIASLIAAFGLLPESSMKQGEHNSDSTTAKELRIKLQNLGVPDWDNPDWNAAQAATYFEPFRVDTISIGEL